MPMGISLSHHNVHIGSFFGEFAVRFLDVFGIPIILLTNNMGPGKLTRRSGLFCWFNMTLTALGNCLGLRMVVLYS